MKTAQMVTKDANRYLGVVLSLLLAVTPTASSQDQAPGADAGPPTESAPQSASQLQALVAPIALYPDSLVAQILTAATFPDEVAIANYWMQQNKNVTGSDLMKKVNNESWDSSVKALTQFPSVLNNLAQNLAWTSS